MFVRIIMLIRILFLSDKEWGGNADWEISQDNAQLWLQFMTPHTPALKNFIAIAKYLRHFDDDRYRLVGYTKVAGCNQLET